MTCINMIHQMMCVINLMKYPKRNQKKVIATVWSVAGRPEPVQCNRNDTVAALWSVFS